MKICSLTPTQALQYLDAMAGSGNSTLADEAMQAIENCPTDSKAALRSIYARWDSNEIGTEWSRCPADVGAWFHINQLEP